MLLAMQPSWQHAPALLQLQRKVNLNMMENNIMASCFMNKQVWLISRHLF
jgi:hypothetical protein